MTKVYPGAIAASAGSFPATIAGGKLDPSASVADAAAVLTVWNKSLLLNCSGFTVFDSRGDLLYRVDNYASCGNGRGIVLMDAAGKPLLTIRRKRLSLGDSWLVFDGESADSPLFAVKKQANLLKSRILARVSSRAAGRGTPSPPLYEIEGSYARRCCAVYDGDRRRVAEVKRKEAATGGVDFGGDVFRMVVEPEIDAAVAMALVIILDRMFPSTRRFR